MRELSQPLRRMRRAEVEFLIPVDTRGNQNAIRLSEQLPDKQELL